jgi:hypothetical protein
MCFCSEEGQVSWLSGINKGYRSKSKQDRSYSSDGTTKFKEGGGQRLAGRLASLNIFISRSAERNLPFFEILKSAEVFQWGPAQQKAFEELKQYLIDLTILTPPSSGAPLLLYVVVSHAVISAALVQEKQDGQGKGQVPVYFVSEVLSLSKKNYTELEKVLYAVLMASRKLRHYFQAYHIIVPSSQPLKDIMRNREATGRIGKWAAELNEFTIDYVIDPQFILRH